MSSRHINIKYAVIWHKAFILSQTSFTKGNKEKGDIIETTKYGKTPS